jgi:hypothetical protein
MRISRWVLSCAAALLVAVGPGEARGSFSVGVGGIFPRETEVLDGSGPAVCVTTRAWRAGRARLGPELIYGRTAGRAGRLDLGTHVLALSALGEVDERLGSGPLTVTAGLGAGLILTAGDPFWEDLREPVVQGTVSLRLTTPPGVIELRACWLSYWVSGARHGATLDWPVEGTDGRRDNLILTLGWVGAPDRRP